MITSQALRPSHNRPDASEITWKYMTDINRYQSKSKHDNADIEYDQWSFWEWAQPMRDEVTL